MILVVLSCAVASGLQILTKVLVDPRFGIGVPAFVLVFSSSLGAVCVAGVLRTIHRTRVSIDLPTLGIATLRGALNVASFLSLTLLLTTWDASTVYPLSALSLVVPVSWAILTGADKKPTRRQWMAFGASTLALALLL